MWFDNKFERTDDKKDIVTLKYIFTLFKCDTFYNNLNKTEKRRYNKHNFINMFETLYNEYFKKNNHSVYIITNHKLKAGVSHDEKQEASSM